MLATQPSLDAEALAAAGAAADSHRTYSSSPVPAAVAAAAAAAAATAAAIGGAGPLALKPVFKQLADVVLRDRFPSLEAKETGGGRWQRDFVCMRLRAAEMIKAAVAAGNVTWQTTRPGRPHSDFLVKCFEAMMRISDKAMAAKDGKTVLVPDYDDEQRLGGDERAWLRLVMPEIVKHVGSVKAWTVCDAKRRAWLQRTAPPDAALVLAGDFQGCRRAEAAVCRQAAIVLQFGGSSADLATGGRGLVFQHCGEVIARKGRRRRRRSAPSTS